MIVPKITYSNSTIMPESCFGILEFQMSELPLGTLRVHSSSFSFKWPPYSPTFTLLGSLLSLKLFGLKKKKDSSPLCSRNLEREKLPVWVLAFSFPFPHGSHDSKTLLVWIFQASAITYFCCHPCSWPVEGDQTLIYLRTRLGKFLVHLQLCKLSCFLSRWSSRIQHVGSCEWKNEKMKIEMEWCSYTTPRLSAEALLLMSVGKLGCVTWLSENGIIISALTTLKCLDHVRVN